jgi:hypothetical protein
MKPIIIWQSELIISSTNYPLSRRMNAIKIASCICITGSDARSTYYCIQMSAKGIISNLLLGFLSIKDLNVSFLSIKSSYFRKNHAIVYLLTTNILP